MFIIWGTKFVKKYLGRRADYCPLCRDLRPMVRRKVESVGHLYYLPVGSRKPVSLIEECEGCGLCHELADDDEALLVASKRASLDDLIAETNPEIETVHRDALSLAARIKHRSARGTERQEAVHSVLALADLVLGYRLETLHLDVTSAICLIATIAAPVAILAFGKSQGDPERIEWIALGFAIAFGIATLFFLATDSRRFARRRLLPLLVRSLGPLDPPIDEIARGMEQLQEDQAKLPRWISAVQLRNAIDETGANHF